MTKSQVVLLHHSHSKMITFLLVTLLSNIIPFVQGGKLLNAYQTSLERLTAPNTFYFLEFPIDDEQASTTVSPMCGNGSPYSFMFRRGSDAHHSKVLVEFEGGPACWESEGCECDRLETPWYDYIQNDEDKLIESGFFPPLNSCTGVSPGFVRAGSDILYGTDEIDVPIALRDRYKNTTQWWELLEENIRDWSYLVLPHCTLDWHLGRQTFPKPTNCEEGVYHRGGINAQAVLDWINTQFETEGGLEALVTTSGGQVGGCGDNPASTSSIAPLFFAAGVNMRDAAPNQLVLTEGSSLWNKNLPDHDVLKSQWNALKVVPSDETTLIETVEYMVENTDAIYAWFSDATTESTEELQWLASMNQAHPNRFHNHNPPVVGDEGAASCPLFAFPEASPPSEKLSTFLMDIRSRMSWTSGGTVRLSSQDENGENASRSRLTFFSIVVILFGLYLLAWIVYYGFNYYYDEETCQSIPSPNALWLKTLTHYPRQFLFISLVIPISLSFAAYAKSGYKVNMNLDFDTYLLINTEIAKVEQSYSQARRYQSESLDIEEKNCEVLNPGNYSSFGRRMLFEEGTNGWIDQDEAPFSFHVEELIDSPQLLTGRELQFERYQSSGQVISILYQNRDGGNVFEPEVLESIRQFEQSILDFPGFSEYCFSFGSRCVPFDSVVPQFFPRGQLVSSIDDVLESFLGDKASIWKVDQYFSPTNLASNITRSFVWLRDVGGDQSAANSFLERMYRDLFWKTDREQPSAYPNMIFTWSNGHMYDLEAADAVNHDSLWAIGSFVFIGLMIFFKVRNIFVFFCGMLGLGLSFSTAYYFCMVHFALSEITLLHVSSLFVMMGIGADDIFLMVDSFDHTKMTCGPRHQNNQLEENKSIDQSSEKAQEKQTEESPEVTIKRMESAYATAGSMMLVSSLTTAICFFSNAFGVVIVIQEFGIYMGMVVLINFLHVMTILPSAILVNELYILPWWRRSRWYSNNSADEQIAPPVAEIYVDKESESRNTYVTKGFNPSEPQAVVAVTCLETAGQEECKDRQARDAVNLTSGMNRADRWLVEKYAPFVTKRRFHIVFLIAAMTLLLGALGISNFEVSDGTIVLFKEEYNMGRWTLLNSEYFDADLSNTIGSDSSGGYNYGEGNGNGSGNGNGNGSDGGSPAGPPSSNGSGGSPGAGPPSSASGGGGDPTQPLDTYIDLCGRPCMNGGLCTFSGVCFCENGWGGDFCTVPVCGTSSDGIECSGLGQCMEDPNGMPGTTYCQCNEEYWGFDCGNLRVEGNLTRREAIVVNLIWGLESTDSGSNLWVIKNDQNEATYDIDEARTFDLSEPQVQSWLLRVVQMARSDSDLNVQADFPTWIELVEQFAIQAGIGFPIPKDLFIGYLDLLKRQSDTFSALISTEVGTSAPGLAGDFVYASITLRADVVRSAAEGSSLSETTFRQWRDFADRVNAEIADNDLPRCIAQSSTFLDAHRAEETISSTATSWLIANGLCLAIIFIFTQNILLSFMVMVVIILIFLCLAGLLFWLFALPFGPVEALGVSIFIGLSGNYSLHIVHAYHHSRSQVRAEKVQDAIFITGSPITASALSTIGGCLFLFACRTWVFVELGILICCVTAMALLFSMSFLPSWLAMLGPLPLDIPNEASDRDDGNSHRRYHHHVHQGDVRALFYKSTISSSPPTNGHSRRTLEGAPSVVADEEEGEMKSSCQGSVARARTCC